MANKLKRLPIFLSKSPWLWRSCSQSRTLSFRIPNDIFRTINSAYEEEEEEEEDEETPRADMSDDEDQIEALVRGLRQRPVERLFLELEETNSITAAAAAAAVGAGKWQVPFKESVAMAVESKEPYLDFKKSMEEMVEAHGLTDWKGMEMLLSWYLKANGKPNHEFIIGAFVDLLVDLAFASSSCSSCCNLCNNSPSPSSSSTASSLLCSTSSCSSYSSFRGPNSVISSNSLQIMEDIIESESTIPCLSSLFEDEKKEEEESIEHHF